MTLLLKIPLKIIALPMAVIVTVAKWFGVFLTSFAGAIFYIFSGLCFLVAVLSYLMGISTGREAVTILVTGFVSFALPFIAGWLIGKIAVLNEILWDFIKS
ncbi:MAG: CD1845 family protein [Lachnospiraceae bacterium]|nr:CD1845 family protein [Lachnospiraceae bacterium]